LQGSLRPLPLAVAVRESEGNVGMPRVVVMVQMAAAVAVSRRALADLPVEGTAAEDRGKLLGGDAGRSLG
jgi:hypothetical protein